MPSWKYKAKFFKEEDASLTRGQRHLEYDI